MNETGQYDDIINLPHHRSRKHPHMSATNRAAQFMPFAALSGYSSIIEQTAQANEQAVSEANAPKPLEEGC